MSELAEVLLQASQQLPMERQSRLSPLFEMGLHEQLAAQLERLCECAGSLERPGPVLSAETTPPFDDVFQPFFDVMNVWASAESRTTESFSGEFCTVLSSVETSSLLVLLGQRTTSGSIIDERAFPPHRDALMQSANRQFDENDDLTCCARALTKHHRRGDETFWGEVSGSVAEKNEVGANLIQKILDNATWWNVFQHFQHGLIYEVRVESGHGARWTQDGHSFIGFVDPFDANQRQDSQQSDSQEEKKVNERSPREIEAEFGPMPEQLSRDELARRYAAGQRTFHGVNLSKENLSNLDLQEIDLTGSRLVRTKLFNTNLEGATLSECDFSSTYLVQTHLSGATARRAKFVEARMDGVKWEHVDFEGSRFDNVRLEKADLQHCRMKKVGLARADLTEANLQDIQLYGAYLEDACLHGARLTRVRFNRSNLSQTDMTDAQIENSNFESANMQDADCTGCHFQFCQFLDTNLTSANLSRSHLERVTLDGAQMMRANLTGCSASEASFVRTNLSQANLNGAVFEGAQLEQADLSRSDLTAVYLRGANLGGADLTGADVVDTVVDPKTSFRAAKTLNVDFGTNWALRQQVLNSAHELTIQQFREAHPILGFFWWAMLGCGRQPTRLVYWGIAIVLIFAGLMAASPKSFDFGQQTPSFVDHLRDSLAVFVTLDLAVDKGVDQYGKTVMLVQMLLSYLMLGFMASLFSSIFPTPPE